VTRAPFYYVVTHDGLTGGGTAYGTGAGFYAKALYLKGYSDPPGFVAKVDGLHLEGLDPAEEIPFLTVPAIAANGQTLHIICEVTDGGEPPLTRYARTIITVRK